MKNRTFFFEIIDNNKKMIFEFEIIIYSDKLIEWDYDKSDFKDNKMMWLREHLIWEEHLEEYIKKMLAKLLFEKNILTGIYNDQDLDTLMKIYNFNYYGKMEKTFKNYHIIKNKDSKKLKQIEIYEKNIYTYSNNLDIKNNDDNWTQMFDYKKNHYHYSYYLESNENDLKIKLKNMSEPFNIPPKINENEEIKNIGGKNLNNYQKYLKYKKKYLKYKFNNV